MAAKTESDAKVKTNRLLLLWVTALTIKYVFWLIRIIDYVTAAIFVEKS